MKRVFMGYSEIPSLKDFAAILSNPSATATRRQPRKVFWAFEFHLLDMCQVELAERQFTFRI